MRVDRSPKALRQAKWRRQVCLGPAARRAYAVPQLRHVYSSRTRESQSHRSVGCANMRPTGRVATFLQPRNSGPCIPTKPGVHSTIHGNTNVMVCRTLGAGMCQFGLFRNFCNCSVRAWFVDNSLKRMERGRTRPFNPLTVNRGASKLLRDNRVIQCSRALLSEFIKPSYPFGSRSFRTRKV